MEMDLASLESVRAFADQYTGPVVSISVKSRATTDPHSQ